MQGLPSKNATASEDAGTAVVVTLTADDDTQHVIDWIYASFSGTDEDKTTLKIETSEDVLFDTDFTPTARDEPYFFPYGFVCPKGEEITVTLAAVSGLVGKLNVGYR